MLAGYRVLVVEDEPLVAEGLRDLLAEAEGVPVGPASSVCEARHLIKDRSAIDAALLDMNLCDGPVTPVLEALSARGIRQWSTLAAQSQRMFASAIRSWLRLPSRSCPPVSSVNSERSLRPHACVQSKGD